MGGVHELHRHVPQSANQHQQQEHKRIYQHQHQHQQQEHRRDVSRPALQQQQQKSNLAPAPAAPATLSASPAADQLHPTTLTPAHWKCCPHLTLCTPGAKSASFTFSRYSRRYSGGSRGGYSRRYSGAPGGVQQEVLGGKGWYGQERHHTHFCSSGASPHSPHSPGTPAGARGTVRQRGLSGKECTPGMPPHPTRGLGQPSSSQFV